ncbi:hypothetical protein [Sulfurimonas sp.]|uniref:hypothetical protein n=1 Tax=Sulfurimonas sp. TaxID=2022749 RepID=UPI00260CCF8D|nr:hypothetical protein [Sulfurimonas sp.]
MVLLFFSSAIFANNYVYTKEISLKKDEQKKILVKYDSKEKLFKFSWTLYINGGLVMHRSYDKIVAQNILYLNGKNQSFKLELVTRGANYYEPPYVLVKFKEFNAQKNEAVFQLFLHDKNSEIKWKFLKNR